MSWDEDADEGNREDGRVEMTASNLTEKLKSPAYSAQADKEGELFCPFCFQTKLVLQKILDNPNVYTHNDIIQILSLAIKGLL